MNRQPVLSSLFLVFAGVFAQGDDLFFEAPDIETPGFYYVGLQNALSFLHDKGDGVNGYLKTNADYRTRNRFKRRSISLTA